MAKILRRWTSIDDNGRLIIADLEEFSWGATCSLCGRRIQKDEPCVRASIFDGGVKLDNKTICTDCFDISKLHSLFDVG